MSFAESLWLDAQVDRMLVDLDVVHMMGDVMNPAESDADPTPTMIAQPAAFELSGSTSTLSRVTVPFPSALSCTAA